MRQPVSCVRITAFSGDERPPHYKIVTPTGPFGSILSARGVVLVLAKHRFPQASRIRLDYFRRRADTAPMESETFDGSGNRLSNFTPTSALLSPAIQSALKGIR